MFDGLLEDDGTPHQAPTLTLAEERSIDSATGRQRVLEWLMAGEGAPDIETLFDELTRRPEWHQQAACRGVGTAAYFPERGRSSEGAKAVCETCEVHRDCLEAALTSGAKHGIWGGVSERGRRALRRAVA
jgi:WhiB family transcriptional regulator, redox-sensing transcriptional regulator